MAGPRDRQEFDFIARDPRSGSVALTLADRHDAVGRAMHQQLRHPGQSGSATLTASGSMTEVILDLSAGALQAELVHIHTGQCGDTLGGVAHPLASFVGGSGSSVTTVDAPLDSLRTGDFAINAHKKDEPGVYTACGNIPSM